MNVVYIVTFAPLTVYADIRTLSPPNIHAPFPSNIHIPSRDSHLTPTVTSHSRIRIVFRHSHPILPPSTHFSIHIQSQY
jgi:hypothetical protein